MRTHTQSKVCQLSRSEASLIPRRPSFLIIYHVGLLMTPPVSTARGPLQCVRASPCVSISVWICVCRHAQITCRSHLDWQHEKPPAPQHTHANTHTHTLFLPPSNAWPASTPRVLLSRSEISHCLVTSLMSLCNKQGVNRPAALTDASRRRDFTWAV